MERSNEQKIKELRNEIEEQKQTFDSLLKKAQQERDIL